MLKLGLEKVGIKIFKKLPECWGESGVNSHMFDSANVMEKMIKWVGWDESLLHIFAKRLGCDIWIYLDGSCVGVNCSCDVQCLDQFGPFPSPTPCSVETKHSLHKIFHKEKYFISKFFLFFRDSILDS